MRRQDEPKKSLRILNSREKKEINQQLKDQWGCELNKELVFLLSNKDRLYVAETDISLVDTEKLKIDNIGLYVCNVSDKAIRLSIEGSQMLGPKAKKNVLDITADEVKKWLKGEDLEKEAHGCAGYVLIRHGSDFIGCGLVAKGNILNFVPKARRILGG
ncbi:hypothetical protein KY363_04295 [Candidatus Woesearchaeota archaeon]|nr:hypothetical protein [Candidatus Woesearchaeota archaeon]